jgi:probable HAF family extracellular repeat protein
MNRILSTIKVVSVATALLSSSLFAQNYRLMDLGAEFPGKSYALGINNAGEVVGYWLSPRGARAFLYSRERIFDLGSLGSTNDYALRINSRGDIVGFSEGVTGIQGFVYRAGNITSLGALGGINSFAHGINDLGHIAGYIETTRGAEAFLYLENGRIVPLGTLGGTRSYAFGLNALDQIVGSSTTVNDAATEAFLWERGVLTSLNSALPTGSAWILRHARGINLSGQVVGWGDLHGEERLFFLIEATSRIWECFPEAPTVTLLGLTALARWLAPVIRSRGPNVLFFGAMANSSL